MGDAPRNESYLHQYEHNPDASLPVGVAVIDNDGLVQSINATWQRLAADSQLAILPDSSGTNLLAICSDADSDTTAAKLGSGLREVLAGESTEFTLEYSCSIQDTDRQFMMGVLPFSPNGASHAIIVTLEITDRQRVADELRFKERVMDEAPVGITISDPSQPDNPLIYANAAFERITGFPTDAVIGKNCRFLQSPDTDPDTVSMGSIMKS